MMQNIKHNHESPHISKSKWKLIQTPYLTWCTFQHHPHEKLPSEESISLIDCNLCKLPISQILPPIQSCKDLSLHLQIPSQSTQKSINAKHHTMSTKRQKGKGKGLLSSGYSPFLSKYKYEETIWYFYSISILSDWSENKGKQKKTWQPQKSAYQQQQSCWSELLPLGTRKRYRTKF